MGFVNATLSTLLGAIVLAEGLRRQRSADSAPAKGQQK